MLDDEKILVEEGYNKIASVYQSKRNQFKNSTELKKFESLLHEKASVLDVGCGAGLPVVNYLVEAGFNVTGIDSSVPMLELARVNVKSARFIKMSMENLNFKNNCFDGLTAFYSIFHVPRVKHASVFQSFHRILKPGGILLATMGSNEWEGIEDFHGTKMFWSHYGPERSLQIINDSGFEIISDEHLTKGGETHYWIFAGKKQ